MAFCEILAGTSSRARLAAFLIMPRAEGGFAAFAAALSRRSAHVDLGAS
ncbi:MAG: hypothetical protein M0014_10485 [Actinomycetota bacterium]|nr:hypothetical protein [Actinomycetota bacterium]